MNKPFLLSAVIIVCITSCREPYEPDIKTDQSVFVVDALITNQRGMNYVKLTTALPYDSSGLYPKVQNATVYVTDTRDNVFYFEEVDPGIYIPEDEDFAGKINETYILTVRNPDGYVYVSNPQTILPELEPYNVYGGYDKLEFLTKDNDGKTVRDSRDVCATYFDYLGENKTPRFRYQNSQVIEYKFIASDKIFFNCWLTKFDYSLKITGEKYASSSININKQEVCTCSPDINLKVRKIIENPNDDGNEPWIFSDSVVTAYEYKRILQICQYRLNDDSYAYYKEIKDQSDGEGKIFDPVITQLKGNITCATDPSRLAFGYFEASTFSTLTYVISRKGLGTPITYERINALPSHTEEGFVLFSYPDFWIH